MNRISLALGASFPPTAKSEFGLASRYPFEDAGEFALSADKVVVITGAMRGPPRASRVFPFAAGKKRHYAGVRPPSRTRTRTSTWASDRRQDTNKDTNPPSFGRTSVRPMSLSPSECLFFSLKRVSVLCGWRISRKSRDV